MAARHICACPLSSQLTGSGQPMHSASVFRRFSYCDSCFAARRLQIHFVFVTFELILDFIAGFVYAFGVHCTLHHNSVPNHNFLCIKSSITRFGWQCCPDQADRLPSPIYPDLSVPRGIILIPLAPSLSSNASDVKIIGLTK